MDNQSMWFRALAVTVHTIKAVYSSVFYAILTWQVLKYQFKRNDEWEKGSIPSGKLKPGYRPMDR